jgi:hypothetical protein
MPGLPVALALFAQAAAASPAYGPDSITPPAAKPAARECAPQSPSSNPNEIVVCAVKPDGYRIDPDLMEARREKKKGAAGRPKSPHESYADHSCATVGPMGCRGTPAINLIAVAAVAAQMAQRVSKGQEVGSMFETTPERSEYQLYLEAKKRREAREEAEAAAKLKAAAQAKAGAAARN